MQWLHGLLVAPHNLTSQWSLIATFMWLSYVLVWFFWVWLHKVKIWLLMWNQLLEDYGKILHQSPLAWLCIYDSLQWYIYIYTQLTLKFVITMPRGALTYFGWMSNSCGLKLWFVKGNLTYGRSHIALWFGEGRIVALHFKSHFWLLV